jgi:hypothetical protein
LLASEPGHLLAAEVLATALEDSSPRIREAAVALLETLGPEGIALLDSLDETTDPAIVAPVAG